MMCSLCLSPWREEGLLEADTLAEVMGVGVLVREVSADRVRVSPGEDMGDSDRGEGEWSLLGPGDSSGSLRDCRLELALSMPAISALARLLDSFLNRLLVFLLLSASLLLGFLATFLLAILMLLGSLLLPPVLMLVVSRAVARMVTASPPLTRSWSTWV